MPDSRMPPTRAATQIELTLRPPPTWGGAREGAGRPRTGSAGVLHAARPALARRHPVHVTLRVLPHVWSLRSRRSFRVVEAALRGVLPRTGFGIVHFSVQGNHVHLIAEAADAPSLSRG